MAGFADPMVTINKATRCHSPGDHIWSFRNRRQFISRTIIVTTMSLSLLILWTRRTGLVAFMSTDRQQPTTVLAWSGRYRWRPILRTRQRSRPSVSYVFVIHRSHF